jgi:Spy/CpxP family protein refolding chaperone
MQNMIMNMSLMRKSIAAALLAGCCAATFAAGQAEAPLPESGQAAEHGPRSGPDSGPRSGPRSAPNDGPGRGFDGGGHGHGHGRFPGGLHLSEAQQDKLFAIEHSAAPQRRLQDKAIRRAHDALREVREAAQYDESKANAAARELGQAVGAQALLAARVHAQMLAVLTPEQREQLRQQLRQRRPQPPQERP